MYSFYGGRPGNSFVIVRTFPSIKAMTDEFQKGPDYTEVHYNEHVLINTPNKNDEDNGKIFRRGYNYQDEVTHGAEYIGTIVGPAGPAPNLKIGTFTQINNKYNEVKDTATITGDPEEIHQWTGENGLVPGKDGNNYNDSIKWKSFTVKANDNSETTAYIGFEIPYPVFEFTAEKTKTPYDSPIIQLDSQTESHPFYKKWNIKIPQGIKGDNLADLKIKYRYQDNGNIYYADENDEQNTRQPWICYKLKTFVNNDQGQDIDKWNPVCPYNVVSKVYQDSDGAIHVSYTDGTDIVNAAAEKMKWVETMSVDSTGLVTIHYTDNTSSPLKYKKDASEEEGETEEEYVHIKWLTDMRVNTTGGIQVKWSDGDEFVDLLRENGDQVSLDVITNLELDKNGKLIATYNSVVGYRDTSKEEDENNFIPFNDLSVYLNERITLPEGMSRQEYQQRYIIEVYKTSTLNEGTALKWIKDISQQGNQITIEYNTQDPNSGGSQPLKQTLTLNYPFGFNLGTDGKLTMQWINEEGLGGAPVWIGTINSVKKAVVDSAGNLLFKFSDESGSFSYGQQDGWTYVGTVAPQAFGFQADSTTITNKIITGFVKENNLYFNLQTSLLLPSSLIDKITVDDDSSVSTLISFSSKDKTIQDSFYIQNCNHDIISGLCGIDFVCRNLSSLAEITSEEPIPVDIYIESLKLNFEFKENQQPAAGGDIIGRIQKIQNSLFEEESDQQINKLDQAINTINKAQNRITQLQQQINAAASVIETSITNDNSTLNTVASYISGTANGNMSDSIYGGTNILNSLSYLKNPPMKILIPKNTKGKDILALDGKLENKTNGTKGRWMHTPGWTTAAGSWNEQEDTQQLFLEGSNSIMNQQHGYVLQWSRYIPTNKEYERCKDSNYIFYFIPKSFVTTSRWRGMEIPLIGHVNQWGLKYLYIKNEEGATGGKTRIHGYWSNKRDEPDEYVEYNNIKFYNNYWVLTAIYGV